MQLSKNFLFQARKVMLFGAVCFGTAILIGPSPSCACLPSEVLDRDGYAMGMGLETRFHCDGRIEFAEQSPRFPTTWESVWYHNQFALAKRGCAGQESWGPRIFGRRS